MTFQQLRYLLEVQRTGSISKAADNLYVSRPSVSFSINSLEEEIGFPIFQRTRQGLIPSHQGRKFLEYAARICETHKLMNAIGCREAYRTVNFSIFNHAPVTSAVSRLMDEYPSRQEVAFSFCIHSWNDILEKLSLFQLDLAVFSRFNSTRLMIETQMEKRGLNWKIIGNIPTVIYIGPGHRLYNEPNVSLADFANECIVDTPSREISRNNYISQIINIPPESVIPCNDISIKYELLEKGLAYTIGRMPSKSAITRHRLRCIPIDALNQPIFCVHNPTQPLPPEAQRFIDILTEELASYNNNP